MSEAAPKRLWLYPACMFKDDEDLPLEDIGHTDEDPGPCEGCGRPSIEYVRIDASPPQPDALKRYDILRLPPSCTSTYFIVEAMQPDNPEVAAYRYEEGDCPSDLLRKLEVIIEDGDTDPHGLFELVRTTEALNLAQFTKDEDWARIVPEAFGASNLQPDALKLAEETIEAIEIEAWDGYEPAYYSGAEEMKERVLAAIRAARPPGAEIEIDLEEALEKIRDNCDGKPNGADFNTICEIRATATKALAAIRAARKEATHGD